MRSRYLDSQHVIDSESFLSGKYNVKRHLIVSGLVTVILIAHNSQTWGNFIDGPTSGAYLLGAGVISNNKSGSLPGSLSGVTANGFGNLVGTVSGDFEPVFSGTLAGLDKSLTLTSSGYDNVNQSGVGFHANMEHILGYYSFDDKAELVASSFHNASGYIAPGSSISISYGVRVANGDSALFVDDWTETISTAGAFSLPMVSSSKVIDYGFEGGLPLDITMGIDISISNAPGGQMSYITLDPGVGVAPMSSVPEPGSVMLTGLGLGLIAGWKRNRFQPTAA